MLIHVTPRIYLGQTNGVSPGPMKCELIDVTIPELELVLEEGKDVVARRPYPNKNYLTACRKVGQKAIVGILVDTMLAVQSFSVLTRWAINAERTLTRRVNYLVIDEDYDTVSDDMLLWDSRWPEEALGFVPSRAQPRMDVWTAEASLHARQGEVKDTYRDGMIALREETFRIPTIERERLLGQDFIVRDRLPSIDMAFSA